MQSDIRSRPTLSAACILMIIAAAGLWLSSLAVTWINPGDQAAAEFTSALLYYLPFVVGPIAIYGRRNPRAIEGMRLNPMPLMPTLTVIFLGLMCVYGASAVDSLWVMLLHALGLEEPLSTTLAAASPHALTLQIVATAAIPAVCEELMFRGLVFSAFEARGTWVGLWVSSAFFALMHANLFGLPAYLFVGAASAFVVYCTDSIYSGMLFHTVYNTAILVIMYWAGQMTQEEAAASVTVASILADLIMVALMIAAMLMTLNLRRRAAGLQPVPRDRSPLPRRDKLLMLAALAVMVLSLIIVQVVG